jgi:hypothetical protein
MNEKPAKQRLAIQYCVRYAMMKIFFIGAVAK